MSNRNTAKNVEIRRTVVGTGTSRTATIDDIAGVLKTMKVARENGIDLRVRIHDGPVAVDLSNAAAIIEDTAAPEPAPKVAVAPRFINLDANCKPVDIGKEHVAVLDTTQKLIFTKAKVPGESNWDDSKKKCEALRLFGRSDWRAQAVQERFAIVDFTKRDPALDTRHFAKESGWEWTSTPLVNADGSPSGYAWCVDLGDGSAVCFDRSLGCGVRAVCAGQQLALSLGV